MPQERDDYAEDPDPPPPVGGSAGRPGGGWGARQMRLAMLLGLLGLIALGVVLASAWITSATSNLDTRVALTQTAAEKRIAPVPMTVPPTRVLTPLPPLR
ncbi:MAG TPA: hypothetical protein VKY74_25380 [Chloroflexia bacterium]|nr:hypothetical protein [Chloroflexia bacterium]